MKAQIGDQVIIKDRNSLHNGKAGIITGTHGRELQVMLPSGITVIAFQSKIEIF